MFLGIIAVIIFLSILILVHELGHFLAAKKFGLLVEEFGFGLPPRLWGKKIGETIYSLNWLPIGGFVKIFGEDSEEKTTLIQGSSRSFSSLAIWKRAVILCAGVLMNFLLGWLVISIILSIGVPQAILITEVRPGSPVEVAGLLPGDAILQFKQVDEFVSFVKIHQGEEISLETERNGKSMTIKVVPRTNPPAGEGALGIGLVEAGVPKQNFVKALFEGFKISLQIIRSIALAITGLLKGIFLGQENVLKGVSGPVGIVKITAEAGKMGFVYLLQLLSLISLNLAVINILPFPALDGGRLLFLIIEKIKGSPLPSKFERYTNAVGMALLLLLMLVITIKDVTSLF